VARPTVLLKRFLIFVHRWVGVALSVIFLLWFASGIVMMYWTFPSVTADDRIDRLPILEPEKINVSAGQAAAAAGREDAPGQVRLTSFDSRPVYRFGGAGRGGGGRGGWMMVYADDGSLADSVDEAVIDRAAAAWARRPAREAKKESVDEVDQWTVEGGLRNLRPLYKYSFPDGQQVYINGNTAEVVQYTTTSSRFWAYLGAIPHWMYFTPLRKHQPQWFKFVVWSSLIGTVTALIGLVVAVWMLSPRKRYRHAGAPTSIPYRGWKRWHTIAGLIFGVVTATWAFSGLLSMGPFPIIDRLTELTVPTPPAPTGEAGARRGRGAGRGPNLAAALRGRGAPPMPAYEEKDPRRAIASVREFGVKELEFTSFAGAPVYLATNGDGETRIIPVRGPPKSSYGVDEVMDIVRSAAGKDLAELRLIHQYDAYYLDRRREAPLPVIYAEMNDPLRTRYYIDPETARVVGTYSKRNWIRRWLYHGLHSLDFPWLYNYRPLWDIVVITLMLGGTALCVTSIVLTWRVLARKVASLIRARFNPPNEDLIAQA
jgi:hypothetical protein